MSAQTIDNLPAPIDPTTAAIEREKSLFLDRNAAVCSHLLVRLEAGSPTDDLVIRAAFTLGELRTWNQVEAVVPRRELSLEAGPDRCLIAAFGQLDDGISTARIARLFAPMTAAQRMAAGRH